MKVGFQFLGIPPKGERRGSHGHPGKPENFSFQFLGIPPKGELDGVPYFEWAVACEVSSF